MEKPKISSLREFMTTGNDYFYQNKYEKALDYYMKALKISEELENNEGQSICYNNLGLVHQNLKNYEEAIHYFKKALEISTKMEDSKEMLIHLQNLVINYIYIEDYSRSKTFIEKAEMLLDTLDNPIAKSMFSNLKGVIYYKSDQYELALQNYEQAIKSNPQNGFAHYNIACVHSIRNNITKALKHLRKAIFYNPEYEKTALNEVNFKNIRESEKFKSLVGKEK